MQPASRASTRASARLTAAAAPMTSPAARPARAGAKRGAPRAAEAESEVAGDAAAEPSSLPSPPITPRPKRAKKAVSAGSGAGGELNAAAAAPASPVSPTPAAPLAASSLPADHPHASHPAIAHLCRADPKLGNFISTVRDRCSLLDGPGHEDTFRALATSIIYQQLAGAAALAILRRFVSVFYPDLADPSHPWSRSDTPFPTPAQVLQQTPETLRARAGLSQSKANFIHGLAGVYDRGELSDAMLRAMKTEEEVKGALLPIKGIGPWTVHMFAMFHLQLPDILPVGDLAIRKAFASHFGLPKKSGKKDPLPAAEEMLALAKAWEPYRSVASWYMWRMTDTALMS
ncbi:DNA glycosylase [Hyaloraphidium curvatum]|nr:DNA glycosylase [Hyaloraphidium curvatum]